jgi:hypothetical protein
MDPCGMPVTMFNFSEKKINLWMLISHINLMFFSGHDLIKITF